MGKAAGILVVILAALAGFYYLSEVRGREAEERRKRLLAFEQGQVEEIAVAKRGDRAVVRREGQGWRLVEPVEAPGDPKAIEGLLFYLSRLRKERDLGGEAGSLGEFGLDEPFATLSLKVRGRPAPLTLHLGERSRLGDWVYARYEGEPAVFLAPARLRDELGKTPYAYELRDKTLLAFDEGKVNGLDIERKDAVIRLRKGQGAGWEILSPFKGAADHGIVGDLLWKIRHSKVLRFVDEEVEPARYGLDRPDVKVKLWEDGGVRTLALREAPQAPGAVYARLEPGRAISLVEGQLLADLSIGPDRLQNRLLLTFDEEDLTRVEIRHPEGVITIRKDGGTWRLQGQRPEEVEESRVRILLEALRHLRFKSVLSDRPGDFPKYGLTRPGLEVRLWLTSDRALPALRVGRGEGDDYSAVLGGSPPIYSVDGNLINKIPLDARELKKLSPEERLRRNWKETKEFLESLKGQKTE